jgi:hypothetical protein
MESKKPTKPSAVLTTECLSKTFFFAAFLATAAKVRRFAF